MPNCETKYIFLYFVNKCDGLVKIRAVIAVVGLVKGCQIIDNRRFRRMKPDKSIICG